MTSTRSSHFKTLKARSTCIRFIRLNWNIEHTEGTVQQSIQNKGSMSAQSEWTCTVLSQQIRDGSFWHGWQELELKSWHCGRSYMIQGPNGRVYRRNRAHLKSIYYDGMSFQDHPVKKRGKEAWNQLLSRSQAHKGENHVLPEGNQLHGCQIHVIWWAWHTSDTPFITITSVSYTHPGCHHIHPPASLPSRESSIEPCSEDSSPTGRKRHQSEPAFIQTPWHWQRTHTQTFSFISGNITSSTIKTGEISQSKSQTGFQHYALNSFQDLSEENWKLVYIDSFQDPMFICQHIAPLSWLLSRPLWFIIKLTHFKTLCSYTTQKLFKLTAFKTPALDYIVFSFSMGDTLQQNWYFQDHFTQWTLDSFQDPCIT